MSGPLGSQQWMYSTGFYPYEIDQSLRFNDDDSAYLSRTPASAGNRKTWTWSGWVKRGNVGTFQNIFGVNTYSTNNWLYIHFRDDNRVQINAVQSGVDNVQLYTTQVFRDVGSWYHLVVAFDTTQATSSDRVKIYVNGEQVTDFDTSTYPAQNHDAAVNTANAHRIGNWDTSRYLDGYMAEVNFIDGQALDATSFGQFKSGVWIPKSYSGSYGTNGFYLDFGNSGSLGADSSGNGNNWTPNNLAATDQVPDSPTNNFPTLNPLYQPLLTYSEGNLRTYYGGAYAGAEPTMYTGKNEKYYSEELIVALGGDRGIAVIADNGTESIGWIYNGNTYGSLAAGFVMPSYTTGDIIGYAIDGTTNQVQFYKNGVAAGSAWQFSTTAPLGFRTHMGYMYGGSDAVANFGQDSSFAGQKTAQGYTDANGIGDFYYAPPSGYLALCTANLPDPAIDPAQDDVPEDYFNTVLYTGNGTGQSIDVGFQPDFVWLKNRSGFYHHLYDGVRGTTKALYSNATDAETTETGGVTSFDVAGFTVGNSATINQSSGAIVSWNWLADNTSGSSNTDGTITSTVSVNQKAGFSIVSYTGNGTQTTTGHGLNQKPDIVIQKRRNAVDSWYVFTDIIDGSFDYLVLNSTAAKGDASGYATQTDTVMATPNWSDAVIAYCFHSVEGYSKISSYTGNGSADGPFVYTGFRPAFILAKNTSTQDWVVYDNSRDPDNSVGNYLLPNTSGAESSYVNYDFLSNGFKLRDAGGSLNINGHTYIYMAFAEMPFKYANAR